MHLLERSNIGSRIGSDLRLFLAGIMKMGASWGDTQCLRGGRGTTTGLELPMLTLEGLEDPGRCIFVFERVF